MGRFTDRDKHEQGIWVDEQNGLYDFHKFVEPSDVLYPAINKLAHYEDMEEQGRLIELPCAVGDTVWIIIDNRDYMRSMKGYFRPSEEFTALFIKETKFDLFCLPCMGKTIFLTKEEAEAKLAELKGE